jgi:hypothetical protein
MTSIVSSRFAEPSEQIVEDLIDGRYLTIQNFVGRGRGLQSRKRGFEPCFRDHTVLDEDSADRAQLEVERQHLLGERLHGAGEISDDLAVFSVHRLSCLNTLR